MYAVIFTAKIKHTDNEYFATANRMRELATSYGCVAFNAACEDDKEIAISYWSNLEQIKVWKQDPEHKAAQALGKTRWYSEYKVQIVRIEHEYDAREL